jgi:hypothetical protein
LGKRAEQVPTSRLAPKVTFFELDVFELDVFEMKLFEMKLFEMKLFEICNGGNCG